MSAPKNNQFASKPDAEKFDAQILLECTHLQRNWWTKCAQNLGLKRNSYIRSVMNGTMLPPGEAKRK